MHTYAHDLVCPGDIGWPPWDDMRLERAEDIVDLARADILMGRQLFPEVYSLDERGAVLTWYPGTTLDTIGRWAERPEPLVCARGRRPPGPGQRERWVVIDSRPVWFKWPPPSEADAETFLRLRRVLLDHGVALLDVVVFDDELHWWSLTELTSGSTTWAKPAEVSVW